MKKYPLILLGLGSFAVASLLYLPAELLASKLPASVPLHLGGVTGTVWEGAAQQVQWKNIQLRKLEWHFLPTHLLKAQLAASLQGQTADGADFDADCGIGIDRHIHCGTLNATALPVASLAPYLKMGMVANLTGTVQLTLNSLDWNRKTLPHASGRVEWQNAGSALQPNKPFGTYIATLSEGENQQHIELASAPDAAFDLSGQANVQADGQYQTSATLKPSPLADADTRTWLGMMLGAPQPDGSFHFADKGQLK